jgi:hydrogenase-4 membrane subunit HyfE
MNPLLISLIGALLIPLFVATWRTSLLGLSAQGIIMAGIAYPGLRPWTSPHAWLTLFDLGLVRGLLVPLSLYTVLRARGGPARNDVIPPNLFSWTLALGMVLAAFNFSEAMVTEPGEPQTLVAIAIAGVLLGLLVLASAAEPFSQVVGVLRIENSLALLELSDEHHLSWGLQLALLAIFSATVVFFRWYLTRLGVTPTERESSPDSLTL